MPIDHVSPRERPLLVALRAPALVRVGLDVVLRAHRDRVLLLPEVGAASAQAHVEIIDVRSATAAARSRGRRVPRIALTWDAGLESTAAAHDLGAVAVLTLDSSALDVVAAVEQAHRLALTRLPQVRPALSTDGDLSPREAEIVDLICRGLSNTEVALHLYLSINSVKTYIRSAYRKMGVERRSQAVLWGLERGLGQRYGGAGTLVRSPA